MQILIVAGAESLSRDIMIAIYLQQRGAHAARGGARRTHCTRVGDRQLWIN